MAKSENSEVLHLNNVRLSYLQLVTPTAFQEGQEKKFQATALLDVSDPDHQKIIKDVKRAARDLMNRAYGKDFKPAGLKGVCFGDGNKVTDDDGNVRDGYKDTFYVRLNSKVRPGTANRRGQPVVEGDPQFPYSGAYGNVTCTLWAQNNQFGKRINGNLRAVQFVKDGEAFGAAPVNVEDEFEALEDNSPAEEGFDGSDDPFDDEFDL